MCVRVYVCRCGVCACLCAHVCVRVRVCNAHMHTHTLCILLKVYPIITWNLSSHLRYDRHWRYHRQSTLCSVTIADV